MPDNSTDKFARAPLSREFEDFLKARPAEASSKASRNGPFTGYVPPPVKLPGGKSPPQAKMTPPAAYDLRGTGKLTPVKAQGDLGACWSFATYGSMESCRLPQQSYDFSENHLINTHGFDWGPNDGGNSRMSAAYLARWSGPVYESDDPYTGRASPSPPGLLPRRHVQEVRFLVDERGDPLDNDIIKQAIMELGAVMFCMCWEDSCYNPAAFSFYYPQKNATNHCVAAVGWDDGFDRTNFALDVPPGDGAFIVRNSWGPEWGDGGYFYVSYYDASITGFDAFNNAEDTANFETIYQYDPLGFVGYISSSDPAESIRMANMFTAVSNGKLSAVGFYTLFPGTAYEVGVYLDNTPGDPGSGTYAGGVSGIAEFMGYHTVKLETQISVTYGQGFSIAVKLTVPGQNSCVPTEERVPGYSGAAVINPGESYISLGEGGAWHDLYDLGYGNICLKAFASAGEASPADISVEMAGLPGPVMKDSPVTYAMTVTNRSAAPAANVTLIDTLPGGADFVSATYGSYDPLAGTITANLGSMAPGARIPVNVTVSPHAAGIITNRARVACTGTDANPADNFAEQAATVLEAVTVRAEKLFDHTVLSECRQTDHNWRKLLHSKHFVPTSADYLVGSVSWYFYDVTEPDEAGQINGKIEVLIPARLKLTGIEEDDGDEKRKDGERKDGKRKDGKRKDKVRTVYCDASLNFSREFSLNSPGGSRLICDVSGISSGCSLTGKYVRTVLELSLLVRSSALTLLVVPVAGQISL